MYTERRRQSTDRDSLNYMTEELRYYIKCIDGMLGFYRRKFMRSTSEQDREFLKGLIEELEDNLDGNQRQLSNLIELISRGRPAS